MTSHQPLGSGARAALRLMGLLAVVAGIVGMHGLANHGVGVMENTHPVMAATSTTSDAPVLEAGTTRDLESLFASTGAATASLTPLLPPGMDMEMAGLCIAVLALGLGVLSLLLRSRGLRLAPWVLRGPAESVRRVGRIVDPPSLIRLSIQRC